jgi:hypothetical protein
MRETGGHIIDLGEEESDEIFFRSTSSMPRSGSPLGDSHRPSVPHAEQGNSTSGLEVMREHNTQDVLFALRYPTQTTTMVEDLFGSQSGDHRRPSRNDPVATTSSLGSVLDDVKTDPFPLGLHSSTASASSGVTMEDTFNFTKKGVKQPGLSKRDGPRRILRLSARSRRTPQDPLRLSVSYGARPPTTSADHYPASFASSTGSRVLSASGESERSPLGIQSEAQQDASRPGGGTPSATSSGSDLSISRLGRPGIGDKMFVLTAPLNSDVVSEPTVCPEVGTLIDSIEGENSKGPQTEDLLAPIQSEQPQPPASSPSVPTSTPQPVPCPEMFSLSLEGKPSGLRLLDDQSMDLQAILSGSECLPGMQTKRRSRAITQTEALPVDTPSKHNSDHFERSRNSSATRLLLEATSFSTEVIDSTVDSSMWSAAYILL